MPYLIDSDWIIDHLANDEAAVALLQQLAPQRITISIVTYLEAYQGTLRASDPVAAQQGLASFLTNVPVLPLSQAVAIRCAHLREDLRRQGKKVQRRAMDLIIAATALEHGLTLVTRNTSDYKDLPGLLLY